MRTITRTLALSVVLALSLAACGSGGGDDGVASLSGQDAAAASPTPSVDPEEALADFAACMREHGIDIPDPQVDSEGRIEPQGEGVDPGRIDPKKLQDAMEACSDLLPQGLDLPEMSPEDQAKLRDAVLKYARCMRENGVDVPDPTFDANGGFLIGEMRDAVDPNDPDFRKADEVCRPIMEEALPR